MKNEKIVVIISLLFFVILYTVFKSFFKNSLSTSFAVGWAVSFFNFIGVMMKVKNSFKNNHFGSVVFNGQIRLVITGVFLYIWFKNNNDINIIGLLVGLTTIAVSIPLSMFFGNKEEEKNGTPT